MSESQLDFKISVIYEEVTERLTPTPAAAAGGPGRADSYLSQQPPGTVTR
jgi:hypothetical protein